MHLCIIIVIVIIVKSEKLLTSHINGFSTQPTTIFVKFIEKFAKYLLAVFMFATKLFVSRECF